MKLLLSALLLCLTASGIHAQALVLRDGTRIPEGRFTVGEGKIQHVMTLANGQTAQVNVGFADIDRMEWPEITQVMDAQKLLAEGKSKEAVDTLQKAKVLFKAFRTIKGNPYNDVSFSLVEVLDQSGDFDGLLAALPEVEAMRWDGDKELKLRVIKLNVDRRISPDQDAILGRAELLLQETDDAAICARLWMTIAEIHSRKERYEQALDAYLHVPVFYGSQGALVPQAELSAARVLVKMERMKDAVVFYGRLQQQYAGSEIAETAKKEMLPINGLPNKPDQPPRAKKPETAPEK